MALAIRLAISQASPRKPDLLGAARSLCESFPDRVFALREAVPVLQQADHPLHLLAIVLRRVLLLVKPFVTWQPRWKFALEELHEMGARATLEKHDVAPDEAGAMIRDRLHRAFELGPRRGKAGDDRVHQDAGVHSRVHEVADRAEPLQRMRG